MVTARETASLGAHGYGWFRCRRCNNRVDATSNEGYHPVHNPGGGLCVSCRNIVATQTEERPPMGMVRVVHANGSSELVAESRREADLLAMIERLEGRMAEMERERTDTGDSPEI